MSSTGNAPIHYCRNVRWVNGKLVASCTECDWESPPCLTSEEATAHAQIHHEEASR